MYLSKIQHVFVIMFIVWQNDWRRCPSSDWFLRFWLLPSYRRCLLSLPTWLIHFSSFNHISSIHDTQRTSESQSVWFFFSFLLQCFFHQADWVSEWEGVVSSTDSEWLEAPPLIIHPDKWTTPKLPKIDGGTFSHFLFWLTPVRRRSMTCSTAPSPCDGIC